MQKKSPHELTSQPGSYALVLHRSRGGSIMVGKFGILQFRAGFYVYIGSAFGPGGVRSRVGRHLQGSESRHWHIDYFRPGAEIIEVWYSNDPIRREHDWAQHLMASVGAKVPLRGFGSSDCQCRSHFVFFPACPKFDRFHEKLREQIPGHQKIKRIELDGSQ